jgi:hypothetical protein
MRQGQPEIVVSVEFGTRLALQFANDRTGRIEHVAQV